MITPILRFPPFALDSQRHVLTRNGEEVPLSPHLVDILIHLASRGGEVVTKGALLDAFWPDTHVTENTLTRAIADVVKPSETMPASRSSFKPSRAAGTGSSEHWNR